MEPMVPLVPFHVSEFGRLILYRLVYFCSILTSNKISIEISRVGLSLVLVQERVVLTPVCTGCPNDLVRRIWIG